MRRLSLLALALAAVLSPFPSRPQPNTVEFTDLGGERVSISTSRDASDLILHFWASWCAPCLQELETLQAIARSNCEGSAQLIAVNTGEERALVSAFVKEHRLELKLLLDPKGRSFRRLVGGGLPSNYILRSGTPQTRQGPMTEGRWRELLGCRKK